jgi:hypothetical protein
VLVAYGNIVCAVKWPSLMVKNGKTSSFFEEKSLVGLTPDFQGKTDTDIFHILFQFFFA